MEKNSPEKLLFQWLAEIPNWQKEALAYHYIFMTSSDSGDFVLSGPEGWRHFEAELRRGDFPLRRIARFLVVRTLFTFLLEFPTPDVFPVSHPDINDKEYCSFDSARFLRSCQRWKELCNEGLSDRALREWLLVE